MKTHSLSPRLIATTLLLLTTIILLAVIAVPLLPGALQWVPDDYAYFMRWGTDAQHDIYAYRYPLATLFWVFVPLSQMPNGFSLLWVAAPFVFALLIFGRKGILVWLSYPFLVNAAYGQIDGMFLLPLYWLFTNHPRLVGISAALLTLKPQLAIFPVAIVLYRWLSNRNWKTLAIFGVTMLILHIPAFILDPQWILKMIAESQVRASEWTLATRGASLWQWWWSGGIARLTLPLTIALVTFLAMRAWRSPAKQSRTLLLLGLVSIPIFYAVSSITAIATLRNSTRHLAIFTLMSWLGVSIDTIAGGWGGAYVIMPITALWLLANDSGDPAPQEKLRAEV